MLRLLANTAFTSCRTGSRKLPESSGGPEASSIVVG